MSEHYQELSFDTVIPSAILINENIELTAVKLFAFIKGLTKLHGYCYATNEYLAQLMKSTSRAVQNWLVQLKKEGYVDIETEKNGIHWQRRIYISDKFKKSLRKEPQFTPPRSVVHPPTKRGSPITKDYSNEDYSKGEEAAPPPPTQFYKVHNRVRMESEKFDKLVMDFGEAKVREMMGRLDEYADINPKRFKQYACHATVIRKWIRDDEKPQRPNFQNLKEQNMTLADKIARNLRHPDVFADLESMIFRNQGQGKGIEIPYTDPKFRDKVLTRVKTMGLSVEGL